MRGRGAICAQYPLRPKEESMTATAPPEAIDERIRRVESGLLPETPLRSQKPAKRRLAERMEYFDTPGLRLAVFNDYRIEWVRSYGVKEVGKPEPVTPETLFQAGSISKPVAATAAMRLVQEGVIDLDEGVNTYLTSWKVPPNGSWQPRITLRQLLSHAAGLTVHGFPGYLRDRPIPTVVQVLDGEKPANTDPVRVNAIPARSFGTRAAARPSCSLCSWTFSRNRSRRSCANWCLIPSAWSIAPTNSRFPISAPALLPLPARLISGPWTVSGTSTRRWQRPACGRRPPILPDLLSKCSWRERANPTKSSPPRRST